VIVILHFPIRAQEPLNTAPATMDRITLGTVVAFFLAMAAANTLRVENPPCTSSFSYANRPQDYGWIEHRNRVTRDQVYYGMDPQDHKTVYVGPDGALYKCGHPPPIEPSDVHSLWCPGVPPQ